MRLFGKYRGTVINNIDPLKLGRLQANVPDAAGLSPASWAMPSFPVGGMFFVPVLGSNVWIEFEQGDVDHPIWSGCFYTSPPDVPAVAGTFPPSTPLVAITTPLQNGITISDAPGPGGGIVISSHGGARVIVNETGIHIDNGKGAKISLVGPSVTINDGALSVD